MTSHEAVILVHRETMKVRDRFEQELSQELAQIEAEWAANRHRALFPKKEAGFSLSFIQKPKKLKEIKI